MSQLTNEFFCEAHDGLEALFGRAPLCDVNRSKRVLEHALARFQAYVESLPTEFRTTVEAGVQMTLATQVDELVSKCITLTG
jgi:hypothetical protein